MTSTVKNRGGMNNLHVKNERKITRKRKSHYFESIAEEELTRTSPDHFSISVKCPVSRQLNDIFFSQPCIELAKSLLGKMLVRKLPSGEILKGYIVETESYLGITDKACHSYMGKRTDRNEAMFLKPGTAYVYSIYGMYYCFNISSLEDGSAVLIRAVEPVEGFSTMLEYRTVKRNNCNMKKKDLCNGPSKLCQAFKIEKNVLNRVDMCTSNDLWLEHGVNIDVSSVISCKRIGIDSYGEEWANKPLRFYILGNEYVSCRNKTVEKLHQEYQSSL